MKITTAPTLSSYSFTQGGNGFSAIIKQGHGKTDYHDKADKKDSKAVSIMKIGVTVVPM